eukprot:11169742-Lingulodinium_polyedra.AAC.1
MSACEISTSTEDEDECNMTACQHVTCDMSTNERSKPTKKKYLDPGFRERPAGARARRDATPR